LNDKKHGFGISYDLKNSSFIIGQWEENLINGIAIYISHNTNEQIWQMENNKLVKKIIDENEINDLKSTEQYKKLHDFYELISSK
jgi:hypothetical protein